jgi:hypothetical protein
MVLPCSIDASGEPFAGGWSAENTGLLKVLFGEPALELFLVEFASYQTSLDVGRVYVDDDTQIINSLRRLIQFLMEFASEKIGLF